MRIYIPIFESRRESILRFIQMYKYTSIYYINIFFTFQ